MDSFASARESQPAVFDEGLRQHFRSVYNLMCGALILSGLVAFGVGSSPAIYDAIFTTPLVWVAMLAPLGFVIAISVGIERFSLSTTQTLFWTFAAAMGVSLATITQVYTGASIAKVFFIAAAAFGSLSIWGYTTKRDLSGMGTFMFIGLIGIIIASLVNLFLRSGPLDFMLSIAGVIVFAGLTAHDTQKIKELYSSQWSGDENGKLAVQGALTLYLDFLNLFLSLLKLFGQRR